MSVRRKAAVPVGTAPPPPARSLSQVLAAGVVAKVAAKAAPTVVDANLPPELLQLIAREAGSNPLKITAEVRWQDDGSHDRTMITLHIKLLTATNEPIFYQNGEGGGFRSRARFDSLKPGYEWAPEAVESAIASMHEFAETHTAPGDCAWIRRYERTAPWEGARQGDFEWFLQAGVYTRICLFDEDHDIPRMKALLDAPDKTPLLDFAFEKAKGWIEAFASGFQAALPNAKWGSLSFDFDPPPYYTLKHKVFDWHSPFVSKDDPLYYEKHYHSYYAWTIRLKVPFEVADTTSYNDALVYMSQKEWYNPATDGPREDYDRTKDFEHARREFEKGRVYQRDDDL